MSEEYENPETSLLHLLRKQIEHEKNGEYTEAETCRIMYEKSRDTNQNKSLQEMGSRHKSEQEDLERAKRVELEEFNQFWESDIDNLNQETNTARKELENKHNEEIEKMKESLDRSLITKVKESSELLNLRKMESHMAKQKKEALSYISYPEAHLIQEKIAKQLASEQYTWDLNRKSKIETALNTLKLKQKVEMTNFEKRYSTTIAEKSLIKKKESDIIILKYDNFASDLSKAQEKEILLFKGEFKSLGGTSSETFSHKKRRSSFGSSFGFGK